MGGKIKNPIKKIIRGFKKIVKGIIGFVGDAFSFVIKPFNIETPDVSADSIAQGVKITKSGTNIGIPIVYGFRRVGGTIVHVETDGSSNQFLHVVYAICEGEIAGVHRIKIDDNELLPHPGTSQTYTHGAEVTTTTGRYANRIKFQIFNGKEDQVQSTLANESPSWNATGKIRKMPGVAYAAFRFEWKNSTQAEIDSQPFQGGVPQIQFDVFGKEVFDVSSVDANTVDLPNDYADLTKSYHQVSTNRPATNPANCLLDYMMNPRYGLGIKKEQIHTESFRIAATKFNQIVTYDTNSAHSSFALTCNAVLSPEQKLIDNVKTLVGGCRSIMPFIDGRYKLKVEDGGNATDITSSTIDVAFDVSNFFITGEIALGGETKQTKFNQVFVNFIDPDLEFTSQQAVFSTAGDQAIDDDEELTGEFTFPTLTCKYMAEDLARMIYDKSRAQRTISFTGTQELMDVEPGDIIRITEDILDLSNKTFRVVDMKLTNDGLIQIEGVEHTATHYPYVTQPQVEIPPTVFLPDYYAGRPLQRPVSDPPKGILPPGPAPEDSAGPTPTPTPPPPYEPIKKPSLITFYPNHPQLALGSSQLINGLEYELNTQAYPPTSPLLKRIDDQAGKIENGFATIVQGNSGDKIVRLITSNGTTVRCKILELRLCLPRESSVNAIRIETDNAGGLFREAVNLYFSNMEAPADVLGDGKKFTRRFNHATGTLVRLPLMKGIQIYARGARTGPGPEEQFRIGGDFSGTNFTDFEYTLRGNKFKDDGLEGFLNYCMETHGFAGNSTGFP
jgi:hypothetical protein